LSRVKKEVINIKNRYLWIILEVEVEKQFMLALHTKAVSA